MDIKQFWSNKKTRLGLIIGTILLVGLGGLVWVRSRPTVETPTDEQTKRRLSLPENVIPVAERPYLTIEPLADGRNLDIRVHTLKKEAQSLEYELEYQAGTLLQGAFGEINLTQLPVTTRVLLGSCSAGGACSYHEDVRGGSLLTRYTGGNEPYALKSDWKYSTNTRETAHSSRDAKFQIDAPTLAQQRYLVVFNTPGYPEELPGELVSDLYSLATSGPLSGTAELTMRANEEGELKVALWNGSVWTTHEGTVEGKMITAAVPLGELYAVIR